jgi:hypothetical protein
MKRVNLSKTTMEWDPVFINELNLIFKVPYLYRNASIVLYGRGASSVWRNVALDSRVAERMRRNRKLSSLHKHVGRNAIYIDWFNIGTLDNAIHIDWFNIGTLGKDIYID